MKRSAIFFLLVLASALLTALPAQASRAVAVTLEGCVIQGVFYAVEQGSTTTGSKPMVDTIEVRKSQQNFDEKMDLSPYEGKKVRMQGRLLPGDVFTPGPKGIKVLGKCDQKSRKAIKDNK